MESEKEKQKTSSRVAIIGLIGTLLTACGGVAGALIGGLTTIYQSRLEAQKIAIAAPQSSQPLTVNTRQVAISSSDTAKLDPADYLVLQELGFVISQPHQGWEISQNNQQYEDLFFEQATNLSPLILFSTWVDTTWDNQPVRQLRYTEPVTVQFIEGSTENGIPVDLEDLTHETVSFYSQMTILALDKDTAQEHFTLYGLALAWGGLHRGGVNAIVANPDSQYVFEQVSWELNNVRVNGMLTDISLERWGLFAEGADRYYIIEVQYVPAAGQSVQVWDDLQAYLDAFRVIE